LRKLHKQYAKKGLYILAVTPESEAYITKAIKRDKIDYAIAVDPKNVTGKRFPNYNASLGYLIGPDGVVVWGGHIQRMPDDIFQATLAKATPGPPKFSKKVSGAQVTSTTRPKTATKKRPRPKSSKFPHTLKLKDGTVIKGRLITKSTTKVFFKGEDGKMKTYVASDVESVGK